MGKLIGKTISIRRPKGIDFDWYTFQEGDEIPEEFEKDVLKQGRKISGLKQEEEKLSEESKIKLEDIKEDLKDDGKLNHSNNRNKKSPGRPKKKKN